MLERRGVEHDVGLEIGEHAHDAPAVAHVRDAPVDLGGRALGAQRLGDRVQRDLGMLHDQEPRRAERHDAIADLRTDRAAAAGDDDRLATHHVFEAAIVDGHARAQQQVLDRNGGKLHGLAAFGQHRQTARLKPQPPRAHQGRFRRSLRHQR